MTKKRLSILKPSLFLVSLAVLCTLLIYLNYSPNTWLTGWDNLHPEFAPRMNLERSFYAVWQEYQSLGLLGGMAHASDLPRQLIMATALTFGLPAMLWRYTWTFAMLLAGPLGVYLCIQFFLGEFKAKHHLDKRTRDYASVLGSIFYLLNLATIQTFFTPFESFTSFYGFSPWLVFVTVNYLSRPSQKRYLALILVYFLSSPSFYVETLFVVLSLCLLPVWFFHIHQGGYSLKYISGIVSSVVSLLITNAFWLLPVIFFVLTNGTVGMSSHINQVASPETYQRNLEFASIPNIALLKGFWFNFVDLGPNQKFDFLLSVWRKHLDNPAISAIGYLNFSLVAVGAYYALKKKIPYATSVLSIALICLFFLLGGGLLISGGVPILGELFRSPFTKFSTPLVFSYSIFFAIGSIFLLDLFSNLHIRLTYYLTLFTLVFGLAIFTAPAFSGNLISPNMRRTIPDEYFQLFKYFKSEDPSGRIANFPQHTFWGWSFYDWGYRGSGFLWYGIRQPILDRAFDVWEKSSENYYDQITSALYSQNQEEFENILFKYHVNYLLLDYHVVNPDNPKVLYLAELKQLIDSSQYINLEKNFNDKLMVYRVNLPYRSQNFISLLADNSQNQKPVFNPVFRPDKSWKSQDSWLIKDLAIDSQFHDLNLPSLTKTEYLVPVKISYKKNFDQIDFKLDPILPQIKLADQFLQNQTQPNYFSVPTTTLQREFVLEIDNQYFEMILPAELNYQSDYNPLATAFVPTRTTFNFNLYQNNPIDGVDLTKELQSQTPYQCYSQKPNRKIEKVLDQDSLTLIGQDVVGCLSTPISSNSDLTSIYFEYRSSTFTPGFANITSSELGGYPANTPREPSKANWQTWHSYSKQIPQNPQVNLLLEANNSEAIQEISYRKIRLFRHPKIFSAEEKLNPIPSRTLPLDKSSSSIKVFLPKVQTYLTTHIDSSSNLLAPQIDNCNSFSKGIFSKEKSANSILYSSRDAIGCDYASLPHLSHAVSYILDFSGQNEQGLPLVACLENWTTRRCDIYERLNKDSNQSILQSIANPNELPGYTLHLYNQSFDTRLTQNRLDKLDIYPIPANYLKNISQNTPSPADPKATIISTHPAPFLYTAVITNNQPTSLNLYQTRSRYWKAFEVPTETLQRPFFWQLLNLPLRLWKSPNALSPDNHDSWYNSWLLPSGNHHLIIIYYPQYLEFVGFTLLLFAPILFLFQPRPHQKHTLFQR